MSSKATKLTPSQATYYSEDFIRRYAKSMIDALYHLHNDLNIVHRDIKPANILMDEAGSPLLVDFGKARQLKTDEED
jgi:serine/threonine protein kinase